MMNSALAFRRADRDVYISDFTTEDGFRWIWSVDSRGRQVSMRTIGPDEDPSVKIAELWAELNRLDPARPPSAARASSRVRSLRLVPRRLERESRS